MSDFELYQYIQSAYRGVNAYADTLDGKLLARIHIETKLDKAVAKAIAAGKSIVLTGNPGDGKTHLLRYLEPKIAKSHKDAVVELDASEKPSEDIVRSWKKAHRKRVPFCIAINESVLLELSKANASFRPIAEAQQQVEQALVYCKQNRRPTESSGSQVAVFDLSRRNVLSKEIVGAVLDKFSGCNLPPDCEGVYEIETHAELMRVPLFRQRLQALFNRLVRRQFHCTLRELLGFVGFLLGRGLEPEFLAESSGNDVNFISELIYSDEAKGSLFEQLKSGFNPGEVCHPILDSRIVSNELTSESWSSELVELFHAADVDNVEDIERRRRRFYFFNNAGDQLLNITSDVDSTFQRLLDNKNEREVLRELLPKINLAFRFRKSIDGIRVWKSHHFAAEPKHEILLSKQVVARKQLTVLYPRLNSPMDEAFEFLPDHLLIQKKDDPEVTLHIDFAMYKFLCSAEYGTSVSSVSNHLTRRLWQFMHRLSSAAPDSEEEVEVMLFDIETGEVTELVVDTEEARYLSLQSE